MKNVKLDLNRKAGFSLVEMLVVIAIIGIIAAIAIPNIGNINNSARQATAQRNAQSVASVLNAAVAAGADLADATTPVTNGPTAVDAAIEGVSPAAGPFAGKVFTVGAMADDAKADAAQYLDYNSDQNQVVYDPTHEFVP